MHWRIHTQGPEESVYVIESAGTARFIAQLDEEHKTHSEVMANGFLLAAAPELLGACEEVLNEVAAGCDLSDETCKLIERAIAKAEGNTT